MTNFNVSKRLLLEGSRSPSPKTKAIKSLAPADGIAKTRNNVCSRLDPGEWNMGVHLALFLGAERKGLRGRESVEGVLQP